MDENPYQSPREVDRQEPAARTKAQRWLYELKDLAWLFVTGASIVAVTLASLLFLISSLIGPK